MMDRHMRHSGPPTKYKHGDKVLLRLKSRKGRIAPKRRHILDPRIVARNLKTSMYKVSFIIQLHIKECRSGFLWKIS